MSSPVSLFGVSSPRFSELLAAHERCESGRRFVASARRTTADAPAGYGRSQLNTRNHVELLGRLGDARLARLGVSREDLAVLSARGAAAQDWYSAVVGGRTRAGSVVTAIEQRDVEAVLAKDPMTAADLDALVDRAGPSFAASTGLPADELRFLASTRLLADDGLARQYRVELRATGDRSAALDMLSRARPALELLRARVGDAWIARYWSDGRLAENRAAWYTRAAMTADGAFERLHHALASGGDRINSERLWADHLRRALTVTASLDGFTALPEHDQLELLGQLARLRALSPAIFEIVVRADDASIADLAARLAALRADPTSNAGAALRAFVRAFE
jgi:hypothetical protein